MNNVLLILGLATLMSLALLGLGGLWARDLAALVRANHSGFIRPAAKSRTIFRSNDPKKFHEARRRLMIRLALLIWPMMASGAGAGLAILALGDL